MSRIYVASSWRNQYQEWFVRFLEDYGHNVYDFKNPFNGVKGFSWKEVGENDPKNWTADKYRTIITTHPVAALGYMTDMRAMEWADTCVLLLPCGRSAHLEAGWFAGRGKRLIILTQDGEEPELMALMANHICIAPEEVIEVLKS